METSHMCSQNVFIMTGIGMMPQWGLLVSFYIQEIPQQRSHMAAMLSSLVHGNRCCFKVSFMFWPVGPDSLKLCVIPRSTVALWSPHNRSTFMTSCCLPAVTFTFSMKTQHFLGLMRIFDHVVRETVCEAPGQTGTEPLQCLVFKESCWW